MMEETRANAPVLHWDPMFGRPGEVGSPLNPYADSRNSLEVMPKLDILNIVGNKDRAFPEGFQPECFFYDAILERKREPRPDFDEANGGALYISRKMIDLLRGFDLGDSMILELPLFEGKEQGEGDRPYAIIGPDYDLPFPDRGGLLHVMARKMSFLPEKSENLCGQSEYQGVRTCSRNDFKVPLVMVLDAEIACTGADIWIEMQFLDHIFCSDRLMQAMRAGGVDSPMVAYSEQAELF